MFVRCLWGVCDCEVFVGCLLGVCEVMIKRNKLQGSWPQ